MPDRPLEDRRWVLSIGDLDVSKLDLSFKVTKSTTREPNTAEIRVVNLGRSNRITVESAERPTVILRVGYKADGDPPPVLFVGNARRVYTERETSDYVTTIQSSDGGREMFEARVARSYAPGVEVVAVLGDAVDALGLGRGNLPDFEAAYSLRTSSRTFPDGFVASGPARRLVDSLTRSAGLRWSVQNGAIQLMQRGQPLQDTAVRLSSSSGLIGSPTRGQDGKVTAQSLIQPGLEPGRRIVLASDAIEGGFEVRKAVYSGQTDGTPWYATLELAPLS